MALKSVGKVDVFDASRQPWRRKESPMSDLRRSRFVTLTLTLLWPAAIASSLVANTIDLANTDPVPVQKTSARERPKQISHCGTQASGVAFTGASTDSMSTTKRASSTRSIDNGYATNWMDEFGDRLNTPPMSRSVLPGSERLVTDLCGKADALFRDLSLAGEGSAEADALLQALFHLAPSLSGLCGPTCDGVCEPTGDGPPGSPRARCSCGCDEPCHM